MRNVHICMLQFLPIGNYSMKYYLIHIITENVEKSLLCDSLHDKKKLKFMYIVFILQIIFISFIFHTIVSIHLSRKFNLVIIVHQSDLGNANSVSATFST